MLLYVLWFVWSLAAGIMGRKRKFGFLGFFLASIFFTPLPVILILALTRQSYEGKTLSDASS